MTGMTLEATLRQEIAELRAAVNRLEAAAAPRLRLRVYAAGPRVFLGQPFALAAAAHWTGQGPTGGEEPARDLPLTFVTSWGTLRSVDSYGQGDGPQVGTSVIMRTDLEGMARVTLLPPGMGRLDVGQQSALWTALDRLDAGAAAPADLQPQLAELVAAYRWEANLLLRQAIDILHSANGAPSIEAIHPEDALAAWRQVPVTVVALAVEDGQVTASALATVRVLDWLQPWLQVYRRQTQTDEALARDLARTRRRQRDPRALLDGIHRDISSYVNRQWGQIGQEMGQRAAEHALRRFVQEGLAELPPATRATLFPALHVASETVANAGVHVLSALTQARVDLRDEIEDQAAVTGSLQQALTDKLDASVFQGFRSEIDASVSALDSQTRTLATQVTAANAAAESALGQVGSLQTSLASALQQKADLQAVDSLRADLSEQLAARVTADEFRSFQEANTAALNRKANTASITNLRNELAAQLAGKADLAGLEALRQDADERFANLVTSTTMIMARMEEVNRSLADINNRFGGLRDEFRVQLEQNQLALSQALASVEQLQGTVGTLPADLGTRLAMLEQQTQEVSTSLGNLGRTVTTLNRNFTNLNRRILDSGVLRPPP